MEVKTDACWEEENAQSYKCEIRPARGAKRQCAEHDKDNDGQSRDHSLRRLTPELSRAAKRRRLECIVSTMPWKQLADPIAENQVGSATRTTNRPPCPI